MKTTIELPDGLFRAARHQASKDGTTLRALVEEGLRGVLDARRRRQSFVLRDVSFGEGGVRHDVKLDDWEAVRDLAYTDHGA